MYLNKFINFGSLYFINKKKESAMIDRSEGRLNEIQKFAATHPNGRSFAECINRLQDIEKDHKDWSCYLLSDFAPMSLYFVFRNQSNNVKMNGGVIYHGKHDGFGSGAAPSFSMTLESTDGWRIHT